MKIDRHNYEKFFILYWDNELAAAEKQAVEDFINQNADLREEFELVGEARFTPDVDVQFKEKDFLLNDSFINITNFEEQLLNYIDDEVTAKERKEVEKFVSQNPAAQKELAILQKTKLQPGSEISFPDKSVLYRREEKVNVISIAWFRVAVAAAIIIIAGIVAFQFVNTKTGNIVPVANVEEKKNVPVINTPNVSEQTTNDRDKKNTGIGDKEETKETKVNSDIINTFDKTAIAQNSIDQAKNTNDLQATGNDAIVADPEELKRETVAYLIPEKTGAVQTTDAGSINIPITDPDVTNKSELALYIPEAEVKEKDGGGLKGFLRKTTRVFERRTKIQTTTEDNKLLVGAFAVSLK